LSYQVLRPFDASLMLDKTSSVRGKGKPGHPLPGVQLTWGVGVRPLSRPVPLASSFRRLRVIAERLAEHVGHSYKVIPARGYPTCLNRRESGLGWIVLQNCEETDRRDRGVTPQGQIHRIAPYRRKRR
jgi:hypothetical protein